MQVIMVRGHRGSRLRGVGYISMTPPIVSMEKSYNPKGDDHIMEEEHVFTCDVVFMMRYFQRILEVMINHLD
jgi:hypothetical protein